MASTPQVNIMPKPSDSGFETIAFDKEDKSGHRFVGGQNLCLVELHEGGFYEIGLFENINGAIATEVKVGAVGIYAQVSDSVCFLANIAPKRTSLPQTEEEGQLMAHSLRTKLWLATKAFVSVDRDIDWYRFRKTSKIVEGSYGSNWGKIAVKEIFEWAKVPENEQDSCRRQGRTILIVETWSQPLHIPWSLNRHTWSTMKSGPLVGTQDFRILPGEFEERGTKSSAEWAKEFMEESKKDIDPRNFEI